MNKLKSTISQIKDIKTMLGNLGEFENLPDFEGVIENLEKQGLLDTKGVKENEKD